MKKNLDKQIEIMNCDKCSRTQKLHETLCKKHKEKDLDPNQANDSGIEYKFDDEDTTPLILTNTK